MTIGAEDKKKLIWLGVLGVFAAYMVYTNLLAGPDIPKQPQSASSRSPQASPDPYAAPAPVQSSSARAPSRARNEEFHPVLRSKRAEDRIDPFSVDPTLHMDLLAKVQDVELSGGARNVFQFSTAPVAKVELKGPEPKVTPKVEPVKPVETVPTAHVEPPPSPPPYKFYGFSTTRNNGKKTAYFMEGDEILLASEGDTLKRRYKILRIGPSSVTFEDLDAKKQVSLPLTEEAPGA